MIAERAADLIRFGSPELDTHFNPDGYQYQEYYQQSPNRIYQFSSDYSPRNNTQFYTDTSKR